jgi:hypothetical protein
LAALGVKDLFNWLGFYLVFFINDLGEEFGVVVFLWAKSLFHEFGVETVVFGEVLQSFQLFLVNGFIAGGFAVEDE